MKTRLEHLSARARATAGWQARTSIVTSKMQPPRTWLRRTPYSLVTASRVTVEAVHVAFGRGIGRVVDVAHLLEVEDVLVTGKV
jgi:hypothetical protein